MELEFRSAIRESETGALNSLPVPNPETIEYWLIGVDFFLLPARGSFGAWTDLVVIKLRRTSFEGRRTVLVLLDSVGIRQCLKPDRNKVDSLSR